MSQFYEDSIFWIDVEKIHPNPFQPRKEFDAVQLQSLADSIRQYGVLQALVVTRKETIKEDGGLVTEYELIAGERRLRASKIAGLLQVPVLIKINVDDQDDLMKLELAIIENVQREDLNPVDRGRAFDRLAKEFKFTHQEIAAKVGKSREYVTNTLRILMLPPEMLDALSSGKIFEGHTRPLMMLTDKPEEQMTLFREILLKKMSVRESEMIARRYAQERVRRKNYLMDPVTQEFEEKFTESLGTRVMIEKRENGGKIMIDFFNHDDLRNIFAMIHAQTKIPAQPPVKSSVQPPVEPTAETSVAQENTQEKVEVIPQETVDAPPATPDIVAEEVVDDRAPADIKAEENSTDEELYSIKNFSI